MKSKIRVALEIIFCVLILGFLISRIHIRETIDIIRNIDPYWMSLGIIINIFTFILTAYSLKVLFDSIKYISFMEWMRFYLMSFSMGLILPGRAGDLSIIYFAKQKGFDIGASTALTIIDKLITLTIFGIIAALGIFTIFNVLELYLGLLFAIFCILGSIFIFTSLGRKIIKKIIGKYADSFQGFYKTSKDLISNHRDKVFINIIITLFRPLGNALLVIIIFRAMGIDVPLFYAILINAITLIVSLIPLTPNGLGIREGVGTLLFSTIGIATEATVAMYVIILILYYITGIVGTTIYLSTKKN
ncbi:MAG: lysylphosphatidylglycerol synthase transmembrane domain-containing protein [bacterium]|nr:lysylphosphatidylglycerol synthase transmembrane domain-containing protein [bacterium]